MRLHCLFLSVIVALHSAVGTAGKERRSTSNVLTPDFVQSVQKIMDAEGIPGLTLAIVNRTGPTELGAWGIKFENGTKMTTDVRWTFSEGFKCTDGSMCPVDTFQSWLLLKSLPLCFSGNRNRRFCKRA